MRVEAIVTKCREKDCPSKPAAQKKWCLLSGDRSRALKCSPSKEGAEEHEQVVNYFKHRKQGAMLTTAAMQEILRRLPAEDRVATLHQAIAAGYRPELVLAGGQLWRLR